MRPGPQLGFVERAVLALVALVCVFLVVVPMGMLLFGSLRTGSPGAPGHFTLQNYLRLAEPRFWRALLDTVWVAALAALLAGLIGISLAWIVTRTDIRRRGLIELMAVVPFLLTPFLGALAWVLLASPERGILNVYLMDLFGLPGPPFNIYSYGGIIWVLGLFHSPVVFLFCAGALTNMDPVLEEAARMVGLGPGRAALRITLPLMLPSILSALLLAFVLCAENFGVPSVLGPPRNIYLTTSRMFELTAVFPANYNMASALSAVLLLLVVTLVFIQRRVVGRRQFITLSGKGHRPCRLTLGPWRPWVEAYCWVVIAISSLLPYAALGVMGLSRVWTGKIEPAQIDLENFSWVLFQYPMTIRAIQNTFLVSGLGATVCVLFVALIAYMVHRVRHPLARALDYLSTAPVAIPGLVMGVGLLWTYVYVPMAIYGSLTLLGIAYVTRYMPYGVRAISSVLLQVHPELEEAGRVHGVSAFRRWIGILLPLLRPGLAAAWVTLFAFFFRELSASIFLYSSGREVISVALFDIWTEGLYVKAAALGLIQATIVLAALFAFRRLAHGSVSLV
jgi:iron(III) transport system permease protein